MKTRILRFLLPAILVAAGSGGVAWTWALAEHVNQAETAGKQSAARVDRIEVLLDEIAHDELAYVASGQIDSETLTSTGGRLGQILSESSWLFGHLLARGSSVASMTGESIASLAEVGLRAEENMRAGLNLMAADLLFTETTRTRQTLRQQLREIRVVESAAVAAARSSDLKQAWTVLAGVALLFAWALVRSTKPAASSNDIPSIPRTAAVMPMNEPPRQAAAGSIDLPEAAALCSAISRLRAEADLQDLLERAAALLSASGVVIWMVAGEELFAVAAHGYDPKQLRQLGSLDRSSLNATAAAWRHGALQTVAGESTSRSAIVAPLLGVDRCIGALAVEVAPGRERDSSTQAAATLIAAQFATVLGAWTADSARPASELPAFERANAST
jgi:GAF domain-containing protein